MWCDDHQLLQPGSSICGAFGMVGGGAGACEEKWIHQFKVLPWKASLWLDISNSLSEHGWTKEGEIESRLIHPPPPAPSLRFRISSDCLVERAWVLEPSVILGSNPALLYELTNRMGMKLPS